MLFACLLPPALAAVVLAAHFYRAGNLVLAGIAAALLALLFVPRAWAERRPAGARRRRARVAADARPPGPGPAGAGEPYARLAVIVGGVALATALAALVFRIPRLRRRFGLGRPSTD
ncbi:MAG: hypothetical protein IPG28_19140 [Betaproteobacteria bacterium]|nr:hypothetical protein [Betaproteobacteria bacterium]